MHARHVAGPRLPVGPLLEQGWTRRGIERALGTQSSVDHDHITIHKADRIACAMGLHPAQLWGADWWQASRIEWETRSRWSPEPLYALGYTRVDIVNALHPAQVLRDQHRNTISRSQARLVCERLGVDPADVWGDDWIWVSP